MYNNRPCLVVGLDDPPHLYELPYAVQVLEPHHRLHAARGAALADDQGEGGEEEEDAPYNPLR